MKKTMLFLLLLVGTGTNVHAQNRFYYYDPSATHADGIFNNPKPGKAKVNFRFMMVKGIFEFNLEMSSIKQMDYLPNLDSTLTVVKQKLKFLADSLKEDGIVRRVDFAPVGQRHEIRITSYESRPKTFLIQKEELNALKTDNDTLRIIAYVRTGKKIKYRQWGMNDNNYTKMIRDEVLPIFLTFTLANISNIYNVPDSTIQTCINRLRQDVTPTYVSKNPADAKYNAHYNMKSNLLFSPSSTKWIKYGRYRNELVPNIYGSLQFARGSFAPSMAAGLRYTTSRNIEGVDRFYLMWEPYFFFSKDATNKTITDRNDFVTFRYVEQFDGESKKGEFDFIFNWSLGYLAGKRGDWFEKNTFKLGLPGVRSGWLQLEPEFYFNDFFKNFSPTLKLTLHYE